MRIWHRRDSGSNYCCLALQREDGLLLFLIKNPADKAGFL